MYKRVIKIGDAEAGMKLCEPVYITTTTGANMLASRAGTVLDEKTILMFKMRSVQQIEIFSDAPAEVNAEAPVAPAPVVAAPEVVIRTESKPPPEKYVPVQTIVSDKLKEDAIDSVTQLFNCFSSDGAINKTTAYRCVDNLEGVVGDLLGVITGDATGLIHINDLKHFDEYTYHHSLSVSMLSIATGRELGLDSDTLFRLGRCAMLHDIGKQLIPLEIINKKGKLTDQEFATVKNHTVLGANTLKAAAIGDVELWNGIMFHHEKINGGGYPKGLKGANIPLFSKIISVADVYDAITSYRSYRLPMLPSEAFDVISKDINTAFELSVVKAFFSKLELYPANTIVELSDGRLGMVTDSKGASRLRPVIRLWGSTEIVNLAAAMNSNINIISVMNPADLPGGYEFM
jgi:putative nucleotidyltransferase with HDIG domain